MIKGRDYEKFIDELLDLVAMQEKEIRRLEQTVERVKQYIEVYEEYIEGGGSKWQQ